LVIENNVAHKKSPTFKKQKGTSGFYIPLSLMVFVIVIFFSIIASDSAIFKIKSKQEIIAKLETQLASIIRQNEQRTSIGNPGANKSYYYEKLARSLGFKKQGEIIFNVRNRKAFDEEAKHLIAVYENKQNFVHKHLNNRTKISRITITSIFILIFLFIIVRFIMLSKDKMDVPKFFVSE
jgi:cell division protein FtsB